MVSNARLALLLREVGKFSLDFSNARHERWGEDKMPGWYVGNALYALADAIEYGRLPDPVPLPPTKSTQGD